jgi:Ribonuclease G/E
MNNDVKSIALSLMRGLDSYAVKYSSEYSRLEFIQDAIKAAVEAEREACAKICEEYALSYKLVVDRNSDAQHAVTAGMKLADKIRARGK